MHRASLSVIIGTLVVVGCRDKAPEDPPEDETVEDTGEAPPTAAEQAWIDACAQTCFKLYDQFECNIASGEATQEEAYDFCSQTCVALYSVDGDLGDYWPYQFLTESVTLENEEQAKEWMDCVAATECVPMTEGYCAPVW